jgi:hypothetical protein
MALTGHFASTAKHLKSFDNVGISHPGLFNDQPEWSIHPDTQKIAGDSPVGEKPLPRHLVP